MRRRDWIKNSMLSAGTAFGLSRWKSKTTPEKRSMRIAHITDVHIRPEMGVPKRAQTAMEAILKYEVDFFLNGGDSIHDASYDNVSRDRVTEQWAVWDDFRALASDYEMHSCLGNHDMWWVAPSEEDKMYGKDYAVQRLNIPNRYYSFFRDNWHFIILDSNQSGIRLDPEQRKWLEEQLVSLKEDTSVLILSHYPILGVSDHFVGGQHSDFDELNTLFYKHKGKVKLCLSGHQHMLDEAWYNGVSYRCNGALSGFWWGKGDEHSAAKGYYLETPPGYAILDLYDDGTFENTYIPHTF